MATRINLTLDSSVDLTSVETTLDNTLGTDEILTDRASGPTARTNTHDTTEVVATRYLADTVDPTSTVDTLQSEWPDGTVDTSQTTVEYQQDQYADDPNYYPYNRSTGLRTPVEYVNSSGYTLGVTADIVVNDVESSVDASVDFEPVTADYTRQDKLVTDGNTVEILKGEPTGAPINNGQPPQPPATPDGNVSLVVVTVKEHIPRITHGGIDTEELV